MENKERVFLFFFFEGRDFEGLESKERWKERNEKKRIKNFKTENREER